ncbi:MAG: hypothetical protein ACFFAU_18480 [Candidatus Hodarchaeota archaeon]
MGESKLWEELEKEYKVYIESVILYYCIFSEIAEVIQEKNYIFRGIETKIFEFINGNKMPEHKTPDLLYISGDEKNAIIIEIVASFSSNYGKNEIKNLAEYRKNFGIDEQFENQNLLYVMPKKDHTLFLNFREEYLSENKGDSEVFSSNFGILLWEFKKEDDCYYFYLERESLPEDVVDIIRSLNTIGPEKHGFFSILPLFLRKYTNLPYTCERVYQLLLEPGKFRKGAYQFDEFEFTLKDLHKEFKEKIESGAIGSIPPPFPLKKNLKSCLEIFIFSGQVKYKYEYPMDRRIQDETVLVSSFKMLNKPFKRSSQRSSAAQVYCRLTANWKEHIAKMKKNKKTEKKLSPLDKYFSKNLD